MCFVLSSNHCLLLTNNSFNWKKSDLVEDVLLSQPIIVLFCCAVQYPNFDLKCYFEDGITINAYSTSLTKKKNKRRRFIGFTIGEEESDDDKDGLD